MQLRSTLQSNTNKRKFVNDDTSQTLCKAITILTGVVLATAYSILPKKLAMATADQEIVLLDEIQEDLTNINSQIDNEVSNYLILHLLNYLHFFLVI